MALDTPTIIADAIAASVEKEFEDIPIRLRPKHIAKIEDWNPSTVWRKYTSGKISKPCRDENGAPWWPREEYKQDLLKRLLAEAQAANA